MSPLTDGTFNIPHSRIVLLPFEIWGEFSGLEQ
jgi:hypothetical protein